MKAYLSIDLDFWNDTEFPERFFNRLLATKLPIYVVNDHEHLLPHVKRFDFDTLINIDYHSDIADRCHPRNVALSCGTWLNYINGYGKHYIWSYPSLDCYYHSRGTCHGKHDPFDPTEDSEYLTRWTKITHRYAYFPRYSDVVGIGIATSEPDYTEDYVACPFYEWLWKHRRSRIKIHSKIKTRMEKVRWKLFEEEERCDVLAQFASLGLATFNELEDCVEGENNLLFEVRKMRRLGYRKMRVACARAYKRFTGETVTQYLMD